MKVIVLGGNGFVGRSIVRRLKSDPAVTPVVAARNPSSVEGLQVVRVDATRIPDLDRALSGADVVINCVTGGADTITGSTSSLVACAGNETGPRKVVHMSSMAVYGDAEGVLDERSELPGTGNWYADAKRRAEHELRDAATTGLSVDILRIGCVFGARSPLWVDRIGLLLKSGRLGDIGELGDGWSNLVHVDDIAEIVAQLVQHEEPGLRTYNLAAPDSPRWNRYFRDFVVAVGCTPLRYRTRHAMLFESYVRAPLGKAADMLSNRLGGSHQVPTIIPPSLLRLWAQQIRLDSAAIERDLGLKWTSYKDGLSDSTKYFQDNFGG